MTTSTFPHLPGPPDLPGLPGLPGLARCPGVVARPSGPRAGARADARPAAHRAAQPAAQPAAHPVAHSAARAAALAALLTLSAALAPAQAQTTAPARATAAAAANPASPGAPAAAAATPGPTAGAGAGPATDATFIHTSSAGDTLIALGRRYLADPTRWPELQRLNRLADPRRIPVGTPLRIPLALMVGEPAPAQLLAVSGEVRGGDGQPLAAGQRVPAGASLRTGEGQATVQLVDGTVLRLRPSSTLQVVSAQRLPKAGLVQSGVRLDQGQAEVKAQKSPAGGQPGFSVGTPQGLLGVRGTEFRVSVDGAAETTRGEVLEGVVATSGRAGQPGHAVAAGYGVVVDASGQVTPPVKLLEAPDLSALPALQERPLVRFTLAPQAGARAWRGQVAADERFEQLLADSRSPGTGAGSGAELRFADLPDGAYVLRVRAEDANGLQGLDALHRFTLKARPEPPLPNAPSPRAVIPGTRVQLAWTGAAEARSYRLQLSTQDDFAQTLRDERGLGALSLTLEGLPPGRYHWRVASERSATDQGPFGAPQQFELRALPAALAAPQVAEDGIRLVWEGRPGQRYLLEFAREPGFAAPVLRTESDAPTLALTLPGTGRFYVRLRAQDPDGFIGPYTAAQQFDVPNCVRDAQARCLQTADRAWVLIAP